MCTCTVSAPVLCVLHYQVFYQQKKKKKKNENEMNVNISFAVLFCFVLLLCFVLCCLAVGEHGGPHRFIPTPGGAATSGSVCAAICAQRCWKRWARSNACRGNETSVDDILLHSTVSQGWDSSLPAGESSDFTRDLKGPRVCVGLKNCMFAVRWNNSCHAYSVAWKLS